MTVSWEEAWSQDVTISSAMSKHFWAVEDKCWTGPSQHSSTFSAWPLPSGLLHTLLGGYSDSWWLCQPLPHSFPEIQGALDFGRRLVVSPSCL